MDNFAMPQAPKAPEKPWNKTYNSFRNENHYSGVTREKIAEYKAAVKKYGEDYDAYYKACMALVIRAADLLRSVGFPDTRRVKVSSRSKYAKYETQRLEQVLTPFIPLESRSSLYMSTHEEEKYLDDQDKKREDVKKEQEIRAYRDEAVNFCIANGKVYGQDFTAETAIDTANDIAYDREVKKRIEELQAESGYTDFQGNNCGDSGWDDDHPACLGWDGESRRCDCGNRRVSWTRSDWFTFKDPSIYGEAW